MRFISRYDEDIMELYDEDPQDGTYYRGKESDEFYDPNAPSQQKKSTQKGTLFFVKGR